MSAARCSKMLQTIGYVFSPLREVDDAACLMEAAALIPPAAPNRATRLVAYLRSKLNTLMVNPRRAHGALHQDAWWGCRRCALR